MRKRIVNINNIKNTLKVLSDNIELLFLFLFLLSRSLLIIKYTNNEFYEQIKLYIDFTMIVSFLFSLVRIKFNSFFILMIFYSVIISFLAKYPSIANFLVIVISFRLFEIYKKDKEVIFKFLVYSGFCTFLVLAFSFQSFNILDYFKHNNFIAANVFVFLIASFYISLKWTIGYSFILVVLNSRGSFLAFLLFLSYRYLNLHRTIILIPIFIILIGILFHFNFLDPIIYKYDSSNLDLTSGRLELWELYLTNIYEKFPYSLFPESFASLINNYEISIPLIDTYTLSLKPPHNQFVEIFVYTGIILGTIIIFILLLPLFFIKNNKSEKNIYLSILFFSMFETPLFTTYLMSIFFYIMLFYLYSNMKFTWRKNEKTVNNNN